MEEQILSRLPGLLLPWYDKNKRDLPWRQDKNVYHIWLSEIMLQQTRVEAVRGYYERFLAALPTIEALAECDDELLHKLWEGLGYYSRVRNLKKAAQTVMEQYGGIFPDEYDKVLALPGIGEYTAGAICSIAFDRPVPAVDGNVLRVIARLMADDTPIDLPDYKHRVRAALEKGYPRDLPGAFTQSLMELGATVCLPNGEPKCAACPCAEICRGRKSWTDYPVKLPKKARRQENRTVFILRCGDAYALEKRLGKGLLAGLWQFPNTLGTLTLEEAFEYISRQGVKPLEPERMVERNHIFTHIRWDMRGYYIKVAECAGPYTWMTGEQIRNEAALPTAFRQFWEELD